MTQLAAHELQSRLGALTDAAALLRPYLPDDVAVDADRLVQRAGQRSLLGREHTVVVLAGSTGSGKSSLFNALLGLDLAPTGLRRPTTDQALACVCGADDADPLLDWLGIPQRRRVSHLSVLDDAPDPLGGLVILDLPDHDSLVVEHRAEVDRLVGLVDLFVWVADPQKYADPLLHQDYLARLRAHGAVVLVALNQIDRLDAEEQGHCLGDLQRLVALDGLPEVPVLAVSATTGRGVDELAARLRTVAATRHASQARLAADAVVTAGRLAAASGLAAGSTGTGVLPSGPIPGDSDAPAPGSVLDLNGLLQRVTAMVDLDDACGELKGRQADRARQALRWPLTRGGSPPDPVPQPRGRTATVGQVTGTIDRYVTDASEGLPADWARAVQERLAPAADRLGRSWVEQASALPLECPPPPQWWSGHRTAQWATLAVSVTGLALLPVAWPGSALLVALAIVAAFVLNRRAADAPQSWGDDVSDQARAQYLAQVRAEAARELEEPLRDEVARRDAAVTALRASAG